MAGHADLIEKAMESFNDCGDLLRQVASIHDGRLGCWQQAERSVGHARRGVKECNVDMDTAFCARQPVQCATGWNALRSISSTARAQADQSIPRPPPPIADSTSAIDYKTSQTRRRPPPLPASDIPRTRTAEEAVTNIIYNTPAPSLEPFKKYVRL